MVRWSERITMNTILLATAALTPKQEAFAVAFVEHGDATRSYRQVFDCSPGIAPVTVRKRAYDLVHTPKVAARVRELKDAIAERAVVSIQQQLVDLDAMAAVDVTELQRVVHAPCPKCHPLYDRDLLAGRPLPDMNDGLPPHPDCADARAHTRFEITPMDQWPPAARRLYEGVEVGRDGVMRCVFRSRNQIADMVNKLLGGYVSRSENFNINATVPGHVTPQQAERMAPERLLAALGWTPSLPEEPAT
jgi:Terminase small subunit